MNKMEANNIILLEGFDMVGKSTYAKQHFPSYFNIYECDHDVTDKVIGRSNSWSIGYGVVDFLQKALTNSMTNNLNVIINRGVFSSYVYKRLYEGTLLDSSIINWYKNNSFFRNNIKHIYVRHKDINTAQSIYEASQLRKVPNNPITKSLDNFNSFRDYWALYTIADSLFTEIYDYIGVTPTIIESGDKFEFNTREEEV